jgi:L-glutamine-phosphate cytidylyltransferase
MKGIILAAGEGKRLKALSGNRPKCLLELGGRSLLSYQVEALAAAGVQDLTLVTGYQRTCLEALGFRTIPNPYYAQTNMVASLLCAENLLDGHDDLLIAYADILYEPRVVEALCASGAPLATTIDTAWRRLWEIRMEDPLSDAETLKLDPSGAIRELGRSPTLYEQIEGQYMGLIKVRSDTAAPLAEHFRRLDPKQDMTGALQSWIDAGGSLQSVPVSGGWLEVDTERDIHLYRRLLREGALDPYYRMAALKE